MNKVVRMRGGEGPGPEIKIAPSLLLLSNII